MDIELNLNLNLNTNSIAKLTALCTIITHALIFHFRSNNIIAFFHNIFNDIKVNSLNCCVPARTF